MTKVSYSPNPDMLGKIISMYEDINQKNNKGETPLLVLCKSNIDDNFSVRNVKLLLEAGADPNIPDVYGWTPLHAASAKLIPSITSLLLQYNAKPDVEDFAGVTPFIAAVRSLCSKNTNSPSAGRTPVFAEKNQMILQDLLASGADINKRDKISGKSALHLLARYNEPNIMLVLTKVKTLDLNIRDFNQFTPLHDASAFQSKEAVTVLIEAGADVNTVALVNGTPLSIATRIKTSQFTRNSAAEDYRTPNANKMRKPLID
eukprot:TRINITY_DN1097_c0_g1_i3.p2 TRINITY_DN1097_c0_g1~~TRINITY_DN1097_c0_g1_i3.p2  ORF type:complete len:260 (-),score=49.18 TRINITY_DN1097_c0_g1_i3:1198-1977(-)